MIKKSPFGKLRHNNIAYLDMYWNKKNKESGQKIIPELESEWYPYLWHLYVYGADYSKEYAQVITPEEKQSIKGLGKFLLCTAISIGLENSLITIDQPIVVLPDGGYCRDLEKYKRDYPTIKEIVGYYRSFGTKELNDYSEYLLTRYNRELSEDDLDDIMIDRRKAGNTNEEISDSDSIIELEKFKELELEEWRNDICKSEYMVGLEKYYSSMYGFEKINPEEHKGSKYYMLSTITNIAGVCNLK